MLTQASHQESANTVLTIGHSAHPIDKFIELLLRHGVTAVCDVRSTPFSRMSPQFNRDKLSGSLQERGIAYVFLGKELGARSQDPACHVGGRVQYERLAQTDLFRQGLKRVREGMTRFRIALMCAERDPLQCHRTILVARYLDAAGVPIQHISDDGTLESHADALTRLLRLLRLPEHDLLRSADDVVADAYRIQGDRIAYTLPAGNSDEIKPAGGASR